MNIKPYTLVSFVAFWILTLSFQSCTEDITDQIKSELNAATNKLVVDGEITTGTTRHRVTLKKATDYFSNGALPAVSNATVYILDDTIKYPLTEDPATPGNYYTNPNVYGIPGHTYTLIIKDVDINNDRIMEQYSASCKISPPIFADSIGIKPVKRMRRSNYSILIYSTDPKQTANYYMFRVRRNGIMLSDTITKCGFTNDQFFNGSRLNGIQVYSLRPDYKAEHLKISDTITLETCMITKDYLKFFTDLRLEVQGSNPFGGQPANVSTNIAPKDLATGFFTAYSITRKSTIVKDTIQ